MTDTTYAGKHRGTVVPVAPNALPAARVGNSATGVNPLNLPGAIDVHRVAAGIFNGELFLTILAESGRVSTFAIAGEALDTLRDAVTA